MQDNQAILENLRQTANRLTPNPIVRPALLQELAAHLVRVRRHAPHRPADWHLWVCELHGRIWLRRWRDAPRRAGSLPLPAAAGEGNHKTDPLAVLDEVVTHDFDQPLRLRLTPRQTEVLDLLLAGRGLRDIGRQLGISHVAVIKLRGKIARAGRELLRTARAADSPAAATPAPGYGTPTSRG